MTRSDLAVSQLLLAMADDELVLGHRDSEWTGHAPILEEDIAFSNIAQDEMGHALIWYTLHEQLTGQTPDQMAFERPWHEFRCCRFVTYPKGDFAYTAVRQFLFDVAEEVRLQALARGANAPVRDAAAKILKEEAYHRLHSQGLVERLGVGTEESHRRMQAALTAAFPQAFGIFEELPLEEQLVADGVMPPSRDQLAEWHQRVVPILESSTLKVPAPSGTGPDGTFLLPHHGGRNGVHTEHLQQLIDDMQSVYRLVPGGSW